jgi:hypothetical protein
MREHKKDLLLFTLFPFTGLLVGLSLLWNILGFAAYPLLYSLVPRFILLGLIFGIMGLVGVSYELKVLSKYIEIIEMNPGDKWPVDRKLILKLFIFLGCLTTIHILWTLIINDFSKDSLLSFALLMVSAGFGFTIVFGMMFTSIAIFRRR